MSALTSASILDPIVFANTLHSLEKTLKAHGFELTFNSAEGVYQILYKGLPVSGVHWNSLMEAKQAVDELFGSIPF